MSFAKLQNGNNHSFSYDLYDESDTRDQDIGLSTRPSISRDSIAPSSGPAIQLLEMANGDTVWSVESDL